MEKFSGFSVYFKLCKNINDFKSFIEGYNNCDDYYRNGVETLDTPYPLVVAYNEEEDEYRETFNVEIYQAMTKNEFITFLQKCIEELQDE